MAALQFQIHADKENVSSLGHKLPSGAIHLQGGKTFQSGTSHNLKTPRRALGSVNQVDRVAGTGPVQLGLKPTIGTTPASVNKLHDASFQKPTTASIQKSKQPLGDKPLRFQQQLFPGSDENKDSRRSKQQEKLVSTNRPAQQNTLLTETVDPSLLPDIEYMPDPEVPEDSDDESIWPKKDRVSTYVDRILSWRPSCLFGVVPESDDEEAERLEHKRIMEELDNIPISTEDATDRVTDIHLSYEEFEVADWELPSIDDIDIALPTKDNHTSCSISANTSLLDDSLGLSSHLGNLVLSESLQSSPSD